VTPAGAGASPALENSFLDRRRAAVLLVLVLAARLVLAAGFRGNYDSESFRIVADAVLSGQNVYAATERYNYSPVWAFVVAGLWRLTKPDFARFVFALGLLATAADLAGAVLVHRIARRLGRSPGEAWRAGLLFFANPVSVLAASAHGQFDGLAILPLLGAILVALAGEGLANRRRRGRATALLAVSLLVKHITAFHPLLFWRRLRRPGLSDAALLVPYAAFAASFLPFAGAAGAIWQNVVVYGAKGAKPSALTALLEIPVHARPVLLAIFLAAVIWALRAGRREELPRAALLLWLAMLVALPTYGIQYLVWPLAVGALYPSAGLGVYVLVGAIFHSSWSLELAWPISVSALATWLAAAIWLGGEAVRLQDAGRTPRTAMEPVT
jgi:Glycosyltransferase family 87